MQLILYLLLLCVALPILLAGIVAVISKLKGSAHLKRNATIAFAFMFNLQIVAMLVCTEVEKAYGLYDDNWETIEVETPYGVFSKMDQLCSLNAEKFIIFDEVAEYEDYVVLKGDSVFYYVDQSQNVISASSFNELNVNVSEDDFCCARDYCHRLFDRVQKENHLVLKKVVLSLFAAFSITALEFYLYRLFRRNRSKIHK